MAGGRSGALHRRDEGLEFDRVASFSDGVFAIALTLLVLSVGVPHVKDSDLPRALGALRPQIQIFFIGFAVIGFYWFGHHRFFSLLAAVDTPFIALNLAYLAAIAFVPFPTALVGEYHAPVAVVLYAATLAAASLLDTAMHAWAHHARLMMATLTPEQLRWSLVAGLIPAVVFLVSMPIAYVEPSWALLSWILIAPAERAVGRAMARATARAAERAGPQEISG